MNDRKPMTATELLGPTCFRRKCQLEIETPRTAYFADLYDLKDGWWGVVLFTVDDTARPYASTLYSTLKLPEGQPNECAHLQRRRCAGAILDDATWRAIDHAVSRAVLELQHGGPP